MDFRKNSSGVFQFRSWDESQLVHGFTTRTTGNFRQLRSLGFLESVLGLDHMSLSMLTQVHSNRLIVKRDSQLTEHLEADGLLTNVPGCALGIRTADCFAILLADAKASCIAAVHAGWRGTLAKITPLTIERMVGEFGARAERIEALVGPGIESCCFEVGEDVSSKFKNKFICEGSRNPRVDLREANRVQLLDAGLQENHIHSVERCSCCEGATIFSYRSEGKLAGRM